MKKQNIRRTSVAEMRLLNCLNGKIRKDMIRYGNIRHNLRVAPTEDKIRKKHL